MTRRAVIICPGRGSYGAGELGYLARHHPQKSDLVAIFDGIRRETKQGSLTELDGKASYSTKTHTSGDNASALIHACAFLDAKSLAEDIEIAAVTGNSMGWYTALAVGGALSSENGFRVANLMGTLMHEAMIGGQLIYPCWNEDWYPDDVRKSELLALVEQISDQSGHFLSLSIDLAGTLVLAGNEAGLKAFEDQVPSAQTHFPMRLNNHAAFHTELQEPVAKKGQQTLPVGLFDQPVIPVIDGRGHIWWPGANSNQSLWEYTLGNQVLEPFHFNRAILTALKEFAPDLLILTGPGANLGAPIGQAIVEIGWQNVRSKKDFQIRQQNEPLLLSMGLPDERDVISKSACR